jgi:hypothetical protein
LLYTPKQVGRIEYQISSAPCGPAPPNGLRTRSSRSGLVSCESKNRFSPRIPRNPDPPGHLAARQQGGLQHDVVEIYDVELQPTAELSGIAGSIERRREIGAGGPETPTQQHQIAGPLSEAVAELNSAIATATASSNISGSRGPG